MALEIDLGGLNDVNLVPVGVAVAEKLEPTITKSVNQLSLVLLVGFAVIGVAIRKGK